MYQLRAWLIAMWLVGCSGSVGTHDQPGTKERERAVRPSSDAAIGELEADSATAADGGVDAGLGDAAAGDSSAPAAAEAPAPQPAAGSAAPEAVAFEVEAHEPSDQATLESVVRPLQIEFSADLDPASVTEQTIGITRSSQRVPGTWAVTGAQATFAPSLPWALAGSVEVELTAAVRSADARALEPARFSFRVRDGQWSKETIGPAWNRTDVSVSRNGHAAVIWADLTDTLGAGGVYMKTWKPGNGWSAPTRVSVETAQVLAPSVAINDAGHVIGAYSVAIAAFVRGSADGSTWTEPAYLGMGGGREVSRPDFVLNADGGAFGLVSTYHVNPEVTTVDGNALSVQTGELTPFPVSDREGVDSGGQLALYRGKPLAVWQEGGAKVGVWSMEDAPDGVRTQLSVAGTTTDSPVVAASDESDAVFVAWVQHDGTISSVWATRRVGDAPFEPPEKVSGGTASARSPSLAIDANGRALLVWEQDAEAESFEVYAAEFAPDRKTWTSPEVISLRSARAVKPAVVREPNGNAVAAWMHSEVQPDETAAASVFAGRYVVGSGWLPISRTPLEAATGTIGNLSLGIDGSGRALLAWIDGAGVHVGRFE